MKLRLCKNRFSKNIPDLSKKETLKKMANFNLNNAAVPAAEKDEPEVFTYEIIVSDDEYMFDVIITGEKVKKIREKLRQAGGHWNKLRRAYTFMSCDMKKVLHVLGDDSSYPISDPSKTLKVNFSIKFQCDSLTGAEETLSRIGLRKDRKGEWQGNINQIDVFRQAFK